MAPHHHLTWLADNVAWFEAIPDDRLTVPVPACPGWAVVDVVNHLSFGLGLGYPVAMAKPPDTAADRAFAGLVVPSKPPSGRAAATTFRANLHHCLTRFRATDPTTPCWTYAGPGTAAFWFRRAAIETTLHRFDVEEALEGRAGPLAADRTADAIIETVEFALPLAADIVGSPELAVTVTSPDVGLELSLGPGTPRARITAEGQRTLAALWGRHPDRVTVTGDPAAAEAWLSLVEAAFAGR
ncbi:MAG: maleylpyruvate isomerase N-terminal domain-containing protein [Actinomycetota bacterium]